MGCDIHLHIEVKVGARWEHFAQLQPDRSYQMFAKMAGVRRGDEFEPISKPKGLPLDISLLTQIDASGWAEDAHTHSWLDQDEIDKLSEFFDREIRNHQRGSYSLEDWVGTYLYGDGLSSSAEGNPDAVTDVRFVFWFDN